MRAGSEIPPGVERLPLMVGERLKRLYQRTSCGVEADLQSWACVAGDGTQSGVVCLEGGEVGWAIVAEINGRPDGLSCNVTKAMRRRSAERSQTARFGSKQNRMVGAKHGLSGRKVKGRISQRLLWYGDAAQHDASCPVPQGQCSPTSLSVVAEKLAWRSRAGAPGSR